MFGTQEQKERLEILTDSTIKLIRSYQGAEVPKFKNEDKDAFEKFQMDVYKKYGAIPKPKDIVD